MAEVTIAHNHPFDPAYGYDLEKLLAVGAPEEPRDLAAFWQHTYAQTLAVPPDLQAKEIAWADPGVRAYEVTFASLGGFRVGGWMLTPRDRPPELLKVVGHGYGGREAPELAADDAPVAAIFPVARGFGPSARKELPGDSPRHVLHGIENRDTYLHRFCVADIWAASTALVGQFPTAARRLCYTGGSFGGGIGAMALAWDRRFVAGVLDVPSFGNHPLRVTLPCVGSGEAVRLKFQRDPAVLATLAYFDAAVHARRIGTPVLFGCAKWDPAVPPPGQFAVHNAHQGRKELFVRTMAHFDHAVHTEESGRFERAGVAWCRRWGSAV